MITMTTGIPKSDLFVIDKEKSNFDIDSTNTDKKDAQEPKKSSESSINEFIKNNNNYDNPSDKNIQEDDTNNSKTLEYVNPLKRRQAILENLVFGDSPELYQNIISKKQINKNFSDDEPQDKQSKKSVWKDSDDQSKVKIKVPVQLNIKAANKKIKQTFSGKEYATKLNNEFVNSYGVTPDWAKLSWQKDTLSNDYDSHDDDSDGEGDNESAFISKTATSLKKSKSNYLAKSVIQIKKCNDVNKGDYNKSHLTSVQFNPTSQIFLTSGAATKNIALYQIDGKHNPKIQSIYLENTPVLKAKFHPLGLEIIASTKFDKFISYDMPTGTLAFHRLNKDTMEKRMSRFEISPDGKFIVFMGKYGQIYLLSSKTKELIAKLKMNGEVKAITFSGDKLLSTGDQGEVYVWDMTTRQCIHRFHDDGCIKATSIACSPNRSHIAVGSESGVVNIYSASSCLRSNRPTPLKSLMNLTTEISDVKFNSTSEVLAVSSSHLANSLRLVHMDSLTVFKNFPDKTDNIFVPWCLSFSPNSGYFSVGNSSGKALLYRVKHYKNY